jgi:protein-L-isoaspartate(D-aspartate) O-methyltransferase
MLQTDFAKQRLKMVDSQLRTTGLTEVPILEAMLAVPREEFVPQRRRSLAYIDEDLEIAPASSKSPARFLMEPAPFAKLVQLAEIKREDVVLDVGCGTGYSSAVLSKLASSVIALECDPQLAATAQDTLTRLGFDSVAVIEGPLEAGCPAEAPYDVIFLAGAVERIPETLFDQLRDGGRLAAVEGYGLAGVGRLYVKQNGVVASRRGFNASVKPLPGFHTEPSFQF